MLVFDVPLDSVCLDGVHGFLQVGARATPSRCVPQCGQRDSDQTAGVDAASGRGCDAPRDGGLRGSAACGRDCVAPVDGELRLSAASGRECDGVARADLVPRVYVGVLAASPL